MDTVSSRSASYRIWGAAGGSRDLGSRFLELFTCLGFSGFN